MSLFYVRSDDEYFSLYKIDLLLKSIEANRKIIEHSLRKHAPICHRDRLILRFSFFSILFALTYNYETRVHPT